MLETSLRVRRALFPCRAGARWAHNLMVSRAMRSRRSSYRGHQCACCRRSASLTMMTRISSTIASRLVCSACCLADENRRIFGDAVDARGRSGSNSGVTCSRCGRWRPLFIAAKALVCIASIHPEEMASQPPLPDGPYVGSPESTRLVFVILRAKRYALSRAAPDSSFGIYFRDLSSSSRYRRLNGSIGTDGVWLFSAKRSWRTELPRAIWKDWRNWRALYRL